MKKLLVSFLTLIILLTSSLLTNASDKVEVYVSLADGKLLMAYDKVSVSDIDNDGKITINDALYSAHDLKYPGGVKEGYQSSMGAYGLKIDMLWGKDNGDSYGYYVNNNSAMSLGDEIKSGDHVYAFLYTDLVNWSDTFSFFDKNKVSAKVGEEISLSLSCLGYDETWNIVTSPVNNADILANDKKTDFKTNDEGKVSLTFDKAGTYVITAKSTDINLVPPVCIINITDNTVNDNENTPPAKPGDKSEIAFYTIILLTSIALSVLVMRRFNHEV